MVVTAAHRVNGARDQLLARTGLPLDEHRTRGRSDARDEAVHLEHSLRSADHTVDPATLPRVLAMARIAARRDLVVTGRTHGAHPARRGCVIVSLRARTLVGGVPWAGTGHWSSSSKWSSDRS